MNQDQALAERIVQKMLQSDTFSAWLGVELVETAPGRSRLAMTVRPDMLNGFGRCHGGVVFALADSALALACNSRGQVAVSIENSVAYPAPVFEGDRLQAVAEEQSAGRRIAVYSVLVTNQRADKVGIFRGTVYRTEKVHFGEVEPSGDSRRPPTDPSALGEA